MPVRRVQSVEPLIPIIACLDPEFVFIVSLWPDQQSHLEPIGLPQRLYLQTLRRGTDLPLLGGPPFKLEFGGYGPPCWPDRNAV